MATDNDASATANVIAASTIQMETVRLRRGAIGQRADLAIGAVRAASNYADQSDSGRVLSNGGAVNTGGSRLGNRSGRLGKYTH